MSLSVETMPVPAHKKSFWSWFVSQPHQAQRLSSQEIDQEYPRWRLRIMLGMFSGYAVFYFVRKNLSAATPGMIRDLGFSKTQIGSIWSALYLSYGVSKFANGVLGDRANPRYFMAIGLMLSALLNIAFGASSGFLSLGILWALNGWFQGMGWPPCAKLLTHWYSKDERGTMWGIWNSAHQVGGAIILVAGGFLTERYGWRSAFYAPALFAGFWSLLLILILRDTPESLGLPHVEDYRRKKNQESGKAIKFTEEEFKAERVYTVRETLGLVLKNPLIWILAIGNFFVYLVRYGAMDWAPTFLVDMKQSSIASASLKTAFFEVLGIGGAFIAGWASDRFFQGRRAPINLIYMVLLIGAVLEFWLLPAGHPKLDAVTLGLVGFLVYGPQMMVGLAAADCVDRRLAATATGFTGLFGYLGSIASGIGTGWIVDHFGWNGGFVLLVSSCVVGTLCFILTYFIAERQHKDKAICS